MKCPKCKTSDLLVKKVKDSDVVIDFCGLCNGLWLDANELDRLMPLEAASLDVPINTKNSVYGCPRCRRSLVVMPYPGTVADIHLCQGCAGIWLFRHQIHEIRAARSNLHRTFVTPRPKESEALKEPEEPKKPDEPTGLKAEWLQRIDETLAHLMDYSKW